MWWSHLTPLQGLSVGTHRTRLTDDATRRARRRLKMAETAAGYLTAEANGTADTTEIDVATRHETHLGRCKHAGIIPCGDAAYYTIVQIVGRQTGTERQPRYAVRLDFVINSDADCSDHRSLGRRYAGQATGCRTSGTACTLRDPRPTRCFTHGHRGKPLSVTTKTDGESRLVAERYRLARKLGTGGMGVVWQAYDERLHRQVAVKQLLLPAGLTADEAAKAKQKITREGRIAARLQHPHAIMVYDVAEDSGQPYLIMEYLRSKSLADVLAERGSLPPEEVARIGADTADALAAAHAAGVIHRDIKPGNVLLGEDGLVKITDFGISRAVEDVTGTLTSAIIGTPAFLSPEVARGDRASFASDVYSLGSTLYAAVEGVPPYGFDDNAIALLYRVSSGQFTLPAHAGPLTDILLALLRVKPEQRPTMAEASDALAALASTVGNADDADGAAGVAGVAGAADSIGDAGAAGLADRAGAADRTGKAGGAGAIGGAAAAALAGAHGTDPDEASDTETRRMPRSTGLPALFPTSSPASEPPAPPAPPPPADSDLARPHPNDRERAGARQDDRRKRLVVLAAAVITLLALGAAILILTNGGRSGTGSAASQQPSSTASGGPTPSQAPQQPPPSPQGGGTDATSPPGATSAERPPAQSQPPANSSPANSQPPAGPPPPGNAQSPQAALIDYYGLMPGNLQEGWTRLTPKYQANPAGGFDGYQRFWSQIASVQLSEVAPGDGGRVDATVVYHFRSGKVVRERHRYFLVSVQGRWLIDTSMVLSSVTL